MLVTGAGSGIGRASAERIAREGGSVFCVDLNAEALEEAVREEAALDVAVRDVAVPAALAAPVMAVSILTRSSGSTATECPCEANCWRSRN